MILHDVDLVPETDFNMYGCDPHDEAPRHLSLSIRYDSASMFSLIDMFSSYRFLKLRPTDSSGLLVYKKNLYELLVGGVLCIKPYVYKTINGFSNEYWLWGGEDDGKLTTFCFIMILKLIF